MRIEYDESVGSYTVCRLSLVEILCLKEVIVAVANLRDKFPEDATRLAGHPDIVVGDFFNFLNGMKEKIRDTLEKG